MSTAAAKSDEFSACSAVFGCSAVTMGGYWQGTCMYVSWKPTLAVVGALIRNGVTCHGLAVAETMKKKVTRCQVHSPYCQVPGARFRQNSRINPWFENHCSFDQKSLNSRKEYILWQIKQHKLRALTLYGKLASEKLQESSQAQSRKIRSRDGWSLRLPRGKGICVQLEIFNGKSACFNTRSKWASQGSYLIYLYLLLYLQLHHTIPLPDT